ncbi:hypothetical protein CTRI78_v002210 [Colletotrichum trifolii]|uniref:Uncharacterized protein n=1 Tax=Colletotrichum trifolii TaxID=5466 RepID=A0A4R8RMC7_COLTR|nr:hypothetical protein CTRI78_v002210 [Colletotrichum trifolii]
MSASSLQPAESSTLLSAAFENVSFTHTYTQLHQRPFDARYAMLPSPKHAPPASRPQAMSRRSPLFPHTQPRETHPSTSASGNESRTVSPGRNPQRSPSSIPHTSAKKRTIS